MKIRTHSSTELFGCVLVLATGVVVEFTRVATNNPWPGYAPWISHSVSLTFGLLWLATAVALLYRTRGPIFAGAARALVITSGVILFLHPLVLRVGGSTLALLYLLGAAIEVFFAQRLLRRQEPAFAAG